MFKKLYEWDSLKLKLQQSIFKAESFSSIKKLKTNKKEIKY